MVAVVFDLDGTLIDSFQDLLEVVNRETEALGLRLEASVFEKRFGRALPEMMAGLVPESQVNSLAHRIRLSLLRGYQEGKITFMHDAISTLRLLNAQGYDLAIASNKPQSQVDAIVSNSPLKAFIQVAYGLGDTAHKPKPAPDLLLATKRHFPCRSLIFVGDSKEDFHASVTAQVDFVLVASKTPKDREMKFSKHSGVHMICHLSQLPQVVERIANGR